MKMFHIVNTTNGREWIVLAAGVPAAIATVIEACPDEDDKQGYEVTRTVHDIIEISAQVKVDSC